jgi:hypothetical protein
VTREQTDRADRSTDDAGLAFHLAALVGLPTAVLLRRVPSWPAPGWLVTIGSVLVAVAVCVLIMVVVNKRKNRLA